MNQEDARSGHKLSNGEIYQTNDQGTGFLSGNGCCHRIDAESKESFLFQALYSLRFFKEYTKTNTLSLTHSQNEG